MIITDLASHLLVSYMMQKKKRVVTYFHKVSRFKWKISSVVNVDSKFLPFCKETWTASIQNKVRCLKKATMPKKIVWKSTEKVSFLSMKIPDRLRFYILYGGFESFVNSKSVWKWDIFKGFWYTMDALLFLLFKLPATQGDFFF